MEGTECYLADVQCEKPNYKIPIQTVGINDFKMPIKVITKNDHTQHTIALVDVYVDLSPESKGISMSRLPIGLQKFQNFYLNREELIKVAEYIRQKSEAKRCQLIYSFPYFINKCAPVSKEPGMVDYNVIFNLVKYKDTYKFNLTVESYSTSLCPCSKEISKPNGAHNQRSNVIISVDVKNDSFVWIEDLVEICESSSSCEIFSVLKRPDEKYVTEKAYNNPKFVEDMSREIYHKLSNYNTIEKFIIEVKNEESIHRHNAYCKMVGTGNINNLS